MRQEDPTAYKQQLLQITSTSKKILHTLINHYKDKHETCISNNSKNYDLKVNCVISTEQQFIKNHNQFLYEMDTIKSQFDFCINDGKKDIFVIDRCLTDTLKKLKHIEVKASGL